MKFGQKKREVLQVREESQLQKYKLGTADEKAVLERVVWSYGEAGCILCRLKRQGELTVSVDVRYWT